MLTYSKYHTYNALMKEWFGIKPTVNIARKIGLKNNKLKKVAKSNKNSKYKLL